MPSERARCLELGLLGLEDTVELGGEHDVALDLELAGHEGLLAVDLAVGEVDERVVREVDGDVGLALGLALVSLGVLCASKVQVKGKRECQRLESNERWGRGHAFEIVAVRRVEAGTCEAMAAPPCRLNSGGGRYHCNHPSVPSLRGCRGSVESMPSESMEIETYLLEVDGPDELLAAGVLDVHLEDTVGLL